MFVFCCGVSVGFGHFFLLCLLIWVSGFRFAVLCHFRCGFGWLVFGLRWLVGLLLCLVCYCWNGCYVLVCLFVDDLLYLFAL